MGEVWATAAEIIAARERFVAALPGWREPRAHAVGFADGTGDFALVNVGANYLPAVVVATVCGHGSGSASYPLTSAQFDEAIALLEPAEACTEFEHPNLHAWRRLRAERPGADLVAVFVDGPSGDPHVERLRRAAGL